MFLWSRQAAQAHKQQLEAELERRAILGHFDFLSRFANDVIFLFDKTGRIIDANQRAVDSYGYDREELLRLDLAALHDPEEAGKLAEIWESVKARGPLGLVFEAEHLRKDGSRFPVEVSARVIEVEGREFRQEIIRDITERKRAEEELRAQENVRCPSPRAPPTSAVGAGIWRPANSPGRLKPIVCMESRRTPLSRPVRRFWA